MRTITVCTLTIGLFSSGFAMASQGTTAKPAAQPTHASTAAVTAPAPAAAKTTPAAKHAAVRPAMATAAGEVTAIDAGKRLLTLKEATAVSHFEILPSTRVTLAGGKLGHESDVRVGERVTVSYRAHGKTLVARSVKVG